MLKRFRRQFSLLLAILFVVGLSALPKVAFGATVTLFSDALSDSRPTILANHDIRFKVDTGTTFADSETIAIKFTGFTVGSATLVQADFAVLWDADGAGSYTPLTPTTDYTIATVTAGADKTATITLTTTGASAIGSNKYIEVTFTNGTNKLPNPAAGASYKIDIDASTFGDTGQVQVAIIEGVTTSATVSASLSVSVALVATAQAVNGATTSIETTATTVPFGTLTVNADKIGAHDITVSTTGAGGYTTTIRQLDGTGITNILNSSTNNIDGFNAASATNASPQAWAAGTNPSGTAANINSGWYGYTTNDATLAGTPDRFTSSGGDKWAPFDVAAYEVAYDSAPVNAQVIRVGHKVETNALQPQGVYNGIVEYITTAIF